MSTIKSSTTTTTAYSVEADTTGTLVFQTGATPTTALTIDASQAVTFAGAVSLSGNQTTTGNLTVNGNTTLGDASTDTILMTGAPSIGGAGLGMGMGFRNRIINGAMVIDQRNAGASVNITTSSFVVDRFSCGIGYSTGHTGQKSTNAPPNYSSSILITVGTGASPTAGQIGRIVQGVEGFNAADLGWGTATAATITLSFWVKSSLTGTFAGGIYNGAGNRTYVFTYAISAANTWEQKTVTIAGDTSGTWVTDNTANMYVNWDLGTGSTYQGTAGSWAAGAAWSTSTSVKLAATSGATFYITGVQLEKGSTATSFDYRPYGTELALCQRYYYRRNYDQTTNDLLATFHAYSSGGAWGKIIDLPVEMRATPTGGLSSIGHFRPTNSTGSNQAAFTAGTLAGQGTSKSQLTTAGWSGSSGLTAGNATVITTNTASAWIDASAEL